MSGRNPYATGYGYSDTNRYDRSDGGYGNSNNMGMNGYGGAGGGGSGERERRPGGYGGFYPEPSQSSLSPGQSPEGRRERWDRDGEHSSSRSRTRDGEADRKALTSREGRARGDSSWLGSNSSGENVTGHAAGPQAIEGSIASILFTFALASIY